MTTQTTDHPFQAKADEAVAGLRELADFIERDPDFADLHWPGPALLCVPSWEKGAAARFRDLVRRLGGHRTKSVTERYIETTRQFGPIGIQVYTAREVVCERVVVGTETVESEVVEWECSPILDELEDSSS